MGGSCSKGKDPEKENKKQANKNKGDEKYKVAFAATEHIDAPPLLPPSLSSTVQGAAPAAAATTTMHNVHRVETPVAEAHRDHTQDIAAEETHVGGSVAVSRTDSTVSSPKKEPELAIPDPSSSNSREHKTHKHHKKSRDKKKKKNKKHSGTHDDDGKDDEADTDDESSDSSSEHSTPKKPTGKEVNFVLSPTTPSAASLVDAATPQQDRSPAAAAGTGSPPADRRDRSVSIEVEEVQEVPARRTPVLVNSTSQTGDPTPSSQWLGQTPLQHRPSTAASSPSGTARTASSVNRRSAVVPVPPELATLDYRHTETLFTPLNKETGGEDHTPYGAATYRDAARAGGYFPSYTPEEYSRPSYTPHHQGEQTQPGSPYFYPGQTASRREEPPLYYPPREVPAPVCDNLSPFGRTDHERYHAYSPLYSTPAPAPTVARATSEPRTFFYSLPSQLPNDNYYDNVPAERTAVVQDRAAPLMTYFAAAGRDEGPRYAAPPVEQEVMWPASPSPAPPAGPRYQTEVDVDVEEGEDPFPCVYGRVYARSPPGPAATVQTLDPIVPPGQYLDPAEQRAYVVDTREAGLYSRDEEEDPVLASRNTYFQTYEARQRDEGMWSSREEDRGRARGYLNDMW